MFFVVILITLVTSIITWLHLKYRHQNNLIYKLPSPKKLPLIHNSLEFVGKTPKQIFDRLEELAKIYGSLYHYSFGPFDPGFVVVSNVKIVEAILSSQTILEKTRDYVLLIPWIGTGLLVSSAKKWFQRRKLLTPGFHFQILERFVEIMDEHAKVFVEQLMKSDGKQVDIFPLSNLYSLDAVCECAMGVNIQAQIKESEYATAVQEMTGIIMTRMFDISKTFDFIYQFSDMYKKEQTCLKILHNFTDGVIQSRRDELISRKTTNSPNQTDEGTKKKKALLDILLNSTIDGKALSNLDIREEVDTFMFAGHDTTTSGISFVFYCLAKHQDVQQKVYEEVMEVFGVDDQVTTQKLNDLHYTELTIRESLRMFPPVPYYGRKLHEELTVEGYTFPKGVNVYVSPYMMGKDKNLYKDPDTFSPHRFDVETTYEKMNPYAYVPFSAGPRNCIGQKFAQYEIRTIVSRVIKNFKLTLAKDKDHLPLLSKLVMRPVDGIYLNVQKRI